MNILNITRVVDKINTDIYALCPNDNQFIGLNIDHNGWTTQVSFLGCELWNNDNYCWPDSLEENEENFEAMLRIELVKFFATMYDLVKLFE